MRRSLLAQLGHWVATRSTERNVIKPKATFPPKYPYLFKTVSDQRSSKLSVGTPLS